MINIILDTNILHKEGLLSGRMQMMEKLVEAGVVTIHIPDIVKREFLTKRVGDVTDACDMIRRNVLKGLKNLIMESN